MAGDSKQEPFFCICWNTEGVVTGPKSQSKSQNWGSNGAVHAKVLGWVGSGGMPPGGFSDPAEGEVALEEVKTTEERSSG